MQFMSSRLSKVLICLKRMHKFPVNHLLERRFHAPLGTKFGHFGDILPSQSLGLVLLKHSKCNRHKNGLS